MRIIILYRFQVIAVYRFAPVMIWYRIAYIIKVFFISIISVLRKNSVNAVTNFLIILFDRLCNLFCSLADMDLLCYQVLVASCFEFTSKLSGVSVAVNK